MLAGFLWRIFTLFAFFIVRLVCFGEINRSIHIKHLNISTESGRYKIQYRKRRYVWRIISLKYLWPCPWITLCQWVLSLFSVSVCLVYTSSSSALPVVVRQEKRKGPRGPVWTEFTVKGELTVSLWILFRFFPSSWSLFFQIRWNLHESIAMLTMFLNQGPTNWNIIINKGISSMQWCARLSLASSYLFRCTEVSTIGNPNCTEIWKRLGCEMWVWWVKMRTLCVLKVLGRTSRKDKVELQQTKRYRKKGMFHWDQD